MSVSLYWAFFQKHLECCDSSTAPCDLNGVIHFYSKHVRLNSISMKFSATVTKHFFMAYSEKTMTGFRFMYKLYFVQIITGLISGMSALLLKYYICDSYFP